MPASRHRHIETNGIRLHIAEQGEGPLVILCHGFPETSHAWRHQLDALGQAGFHAVAPDLRGYGDSDCPPDVAQYSALDVIGDLVGLVDALGQRQAVLVGNDWGASIAWQAAQLRPDRFRAVAALGVPMMGLSLIHISMCGGRFHRKSPHSSATRGRCCIEGSMRRFATIRYSCWTR